MTEPNSNFIPSVNIESPPKKDFWDEIGFHRQLGGLFWEIGFSIFHIILGVITGVLIFPIIYPFPEIKGYYATATNVFIAIFVTFDLGTASLLNRFVGANTTNPKKMLKYVQYFIWYQMFSGLLQVTVISIWALSMPVESLIYFTYIFIFYSLVQYPAMTTIFKDVLTTLQQFDKASKLNFISGDVIQSTFEIGFCLLFRYTLGQNPVYGVILGISIGLVFGKYLDDFISMAIGMKFFRKAMEKYNITVLDCFGHDFDGNLVKETFLYGLKTGFPGVISSFFGLLILTWWLTVPQYTTFVALLGLANSLINFIKNMKFELGGAVAESYLNNKLNLCQYYVGQMFRYNGLVQILLYSIMIVASFVFKDIFNLFGMTEYVLAIPFIYTSIVRRLFLPYESLASNIIISTNHPNFYFIISIVQMFLSLGWWFFILVFLKVPQTYGIEAIIWVMAVGDLPLALFWLSVLYWYIHKHIFPLKIPWWQAFGAPGTTAIIVIFAGYLYLQFGYEPLKMLGGVFLGVIPAAFIFVIMLPFVIWMPLTVLLGGWDDKSIETFRKATNIAGFMKKPIDLMLKGILWASPKSKLHNHFQPDYTEAFREAEELMILIQQQKKKN